MGNQTLRVSYANERGLSLVEALAGVLVLVVITALSMQLIITSKQTEIVMDVRAQFEKELQFKTAELRNTATISKIIFPANPSLKKQLQSCFSNKPTTGRPATSDFLTAQSCSTGSRSGCCQFHQPEFIVYLPSQNRSSRQEHNSSAISASPKRWSERLVQRTFYKISCGQNQCFRVELKSDISFDSQGLPASQSIAVKDRSIQVSVPGSLLADRASVSYDCAATGKIISGIDYDQLKAECTGLSGKMFCSGWAPMKNFGGIVTNDCQIPVDLRCQNGFGVNSTGLLDGQGVCVNGSPLGGGGP